MVGEALDREPLEAAAAVGPGVGAGQPAAARVQAEQLAQELQRRDRAARERAADPADRRGLTEQDLVGAVPAGAEGPDPGRGELPVDHRGGGHEPVALALVLRRQPARLVGLVADGPAADAREQAPALVLVGVAPRVAAGEGADELAEGLRA